MESKVRENFFRTKLKTFIPFKLQKFLYGYVKKYRLLKNKAKGNYKKEDLKGFLESAGIGNWDIVMVHSSLGRIGFVEGGADTLIDALIETVGENGTIMMPAFSSPEFDENNNSYVLDVKKTPAYTGSVPETFRKREGVLRSMSPLHSVAACGKKAEWFVKGHEDCDNGYSLDGPFGKLYESDAKIVLIGVDQLANSSIHIVENRGKFPIKVFSGNIDAIVIDEKGNRKKVKFRKHLPYLYKIRKNNIMEKYLLEGKIMKIYPFGNTEIRVMKVRDFVHCMEKLLDKGITIYNQ